MAEGPVRTGKPRGNLPPLDLYVPEPKYRPGDTVDYTHLEIPEPGLLARPDEACEAQDTWPLTLDMIRVLGDDDRAVGPWNPGLDAETLRRMLATMALTRAFDDRMYRGQRQGKTSFYMKCTGEEAISIACAVVSKVSTERTGPNTSSRATGMSGVTLARIVGAMNWPRPRSSALKCVWPA